MRRIVFTILLFACFIFLSFNLACAGLGYHIKCDNCGAEEDLLFGYGMISKVIANGYCNNCKKFVSLGHGTAKDENGLYQIYDGKNWTTMTEEEIEAMEEPIGYANSPNSGEKRALYPCPICGEPFIQIIEEDFGTPENPAKIYCPICGKKTLHGQGGILWD